MPKIGKIRADYEANFSEFEVHYKQGFGFWIKGLSVEFKTLTEFPPYFETEAKLRDATFSAVKKFKEIKESSRIVILYKFYASAELSMNKVDEGHFSGVLKGVSKKIGHFNVGSPKSSIGLNFRVALEVRNSHEVEYFEVDENHKAKIFTIRNSSEFEVIEYTPDRYQFFEGIVESMREMVRQASAFFGLENKEVEKLLDSKKQFLLMGKGK